MSFALAALAAGCLFPEQRRPSRRTSPAPSPPEIAAPPAAPAWPAAPAPSRSRQPLSQATQVSQVSRGSSQFAPAPLAGEPGPRPVSPAGDIDVPRREPAAWGPRPRVRPETPPEVVRPVVRRAPPEPAPVPVPEPAPIPEPAPAPAPEPVPAPEPAPVPAPEPTPAPAPEPEVVVEPPSAAGIGHDDDESGATGRPEPAGPAVEEPQPVPAIGTGIGNSEENDGDVMESDRGAPPVRETSRTRRILDLLKRAVGFPASESAQEDGEIEPKPEMDTLRKYLEEDTGTEGAAHGAEPDGDATGTSALPPEQPASGAAPSSPKLEEALRQLQAAARMDHEQAVLHMRAAEEQFAQRKFAKARQEALSAVKLDPDLREEVEKILLRINREERKRPDSP